MKQVNNYIIFVSQSYMLYTNISQQYYNGLLHTFFCTHDIYTTYNRNNKERSAILSMCKNAFIKKSAVSKSVKVK